MGEWELAAGRTSLKGCQYGAIGLPLLLRAQQKLRGRSSQMWQLVGASCGKRREIAKNSPYIVTSGHQLSGSFSCQRDKCRSKQK
jgi:hypothetical protein